MSISEPRLCVSNSIQGLKADVKCVNISPLPLECVIVHSRQSAATTGLFRELHANPLSEKKHINNNIPRQHSTQQTDRQTAHVTGHQQPLKQEAEQRLLWVYQHTKQLIQTSW